METCYHMKEYERGKEIPNFVEAANKEETKWVWELFGKSQWYCWRYVGGCLTRVDLQRRGELDATRTCEEVA